MPLWILLACRPPPEAPAETGALGRFLFAHFDDEDPTELEAGLANLADLLRSQDYDANIQTRTFTMPPLRPEDLGSLSLPEGTASEDQVGVSGSGRSAFPLEDQLELIVDPVQTCIESAATTWAGRAFVSDPGCFFASCDRLEVLDEVRRENTLAKVWYDQPKVYRALSTTGLDDADDDVDVVIGRAHIERVFEGDGGTNAYRQLFVLDAFFRDGDRTLRWFSSWSEIDITAVGDDLVANLIVSGLEQALEFGEERLAGNESSCPHDRSAPPPPRP